MSYFLLTFLSDKIKLWTEGGENVVLFINFLFLKYGFVKFDSFCLIIWIISWVLKYSEKGRHCFRNSKIYDLDLIKLILILVLNNSFLILFSIIRSDLLCISFNIFFY